VARCCALQAGTPLNHPCLPSCRLAHAIAICALAGRRPFIVHGGPQLLFVITVFGVATLCATAFLFVVQMYEDLTRG
jgi:hypothetical protein